MTTEENETIAIQTLLNLSNQPSNINQFTTRQQNQTTNQLFDFIDENDDEEEEEEEISEDEDLEKEEEEEGEKEDNFQDAIDLLCLRIRHLTIDQDDDGNLEMNEKNRKRKIDEVESYVPPEEEI